MSHQTGSTDPQRRDAPNFGVDVLGSRGVISSMYRLGQDSRNQEALTDDGKRVLSWKIGSHDLALSPIAGWDIFPLELEGNEGHLYLPTGTRNAHSVLSGMEAWEGEKRAVVERAAKYLTDVYGRFGTDDIGFAWNQVGITPDQDIFVAPPHALAVEHEGQADAWQAAAANELSILLQNDTANNDLVDFFTQSIQKG